MLPAFCDGTPRRISTMGDSGRRNSTSGLTDSTLATPSSSSSKSNRRPLSNKKTVPKATDKALIQILLGPLRHIERHYQIYDKDQGIFGKKNSTLRRAVIDRRRFLEKARIERPEEFHTLCIEHDLQPPPPPTAVEYLASELDSSRMSNRYREKGKQKEGIISYSQPFLILLLCLLLLRGQQQR